MRPKAEVSPHRSVLSVRWRLAPISPAPALGCDRKLWPARPTPVGLTSVEDHGDSRIASEALAQLLAEFRAIAVDDDEPSAQPPEACSCALMVLPNAGSGPRRGTHMALVDPLAITFLAIVVVVSRRSRDRPPPGRGGRETLPQHRPEDRVRLVELPEAVVHRPDGLPNQPRHGRVGDAPARARPS